LRTSIIIAAHNEGEELVKTVESCVATAAGLDYEIVVVDDASSDGMPELVARRFAPVRLYRQAPRQGVSPTKHHGAGQARGDLFIFLDGHTKPEPGALHQLLRAVEDTAGQAVITPRIVALDVRRWENATAQVGHGYAFDLATLDARWVPLGEMRKSPLGRGNLFESAALIGCAFAVRRAVYDRVWGFDAQMRFWGVEDLDFSLKCWLLGHPILHHPGIVIGHRFQDAFTTYSVPWEHILVNQLRMAYKNYTHGVWSAWLDAARVRHGEALPEHPEGLWAHGWELFKRGEDTARQERAYLHAQRARDEFWYARHFGLPWPQLTRQAGQGHPGALQGLVLAKNPSPSPSPPPSPSPSPPPGCGFTLTGPADVPGLSQYNYQIALGAATATGISWSLDKATASFVGPTDQATVAVAFKNTAADWITLRADFTVAGQPACAEMKIALVQVTLGTPTLATPGKVGAVSPGNFSFLVTPPATLSASRPW
jgi:GT2 family glycosyltransferase